MRVTVLCVLAFAGATCALQIPSIPSPQSVLDQGSSLLNNLPGINQNSDDSSSSSSDSSSQEDRNTPEIATELAERLVEDVLKAGAGLGSAAMLPLKVGASLLNTLTKEISNFLGNVLPENLGDSTVLELAGELAESVVHDIERMARNVGTLLLEPEKLKAQLVQSLASDISQWLQKTQDRLSGPNSGEPKHRHPTHRPRPTPPNHHRPTSSPRPRPTSTQRPRPTPPNHPRPTSSPRPRPTSTSERPRPSSSERPRPTRPAQPSTPRPRPTPSEGPRPTSSERPRPTPPAHPSTPRPRPTPPAQPSTPRPRPPTPPAQPSTPRPRPTPPARPSTSVVPTLPPLPSTPVIPNLPPLPSTPSSEEDPIGF